MRRVLLVLAVLLVASCKIERRPTDPESPVTQVLVLPDTILIDPLGTWQFSVYGRNTTGDSVPVSVHWSASAGDISSGAWFTADSSEDDVTVTATLSSSSALRGAALVRKRKVVQILLAPDGATLLPGAIQQFSARGVRSSGDTVGLAVTYSATGGSISSSGVFGAGQVPGTYRVIGTRRALADTAVITILNPPVATVTVSPASANLNVGRAAELTATARDAAGNVLTGRPITWSSDAPGVASVTASGVVTAAAVGSAIITATSEGRTGSAAVTVTAVPVASVVVTPATATLRVGTTTQLTAVPKDSAGNTLTGRAVTWSSSAPSVATVSASGVVSAAGIGSATITATSEGKSGTSAITVTLVPVATVTVTPASTSLSVGGTQQLTAVTKDSAGNTLTGRTVTWSSNAVVVATISAAGLVTAVAAGSATMTATSEGKTGSAAITVTVSPPPPPPPPPPPAPRAGYYVAPNGTSGNDGSWDRPWNLAHALAGAGGRIMPGDTVWLRGGRYNGTFTSSLRGTAAAPIVVRQYPGERATLDGTSSSSITLNVDGQWTIYWGFEITNNITARFGSGLAARPSGVYVRNASNVRLVNLIIHDTGHGTYIEETAHNIEIYGWIVYNGGNDNSSRSDGHGIYVRNDGTTPKLIADNIIFNQFGFGLHGYAEGGDRLNRMIFDGNILFNNGELSVFDSPNMILGGETSADADTIRNNIMYFSPGRGPRNMRLGYSTSQQNGSAVFENNYLVGGATQGVDITLWSNLQFRNNTIVHTGRVLTFADANTSRYGWTGNTYYRNPTANAWRFGGTDYTFDEWRQATGLGGTDVVVPTGPSVPAVFVRPNRYEPGRANVVVLNWGRLSSVLVDLSNVLSVGQRFEIRNVQDLWGIPVVSGVFGGGSVSVPMNGVAPPQPVGGSPTAPIRTGPDFDVFVVIPVP